MDFAFSETTEDWRRRVQAFMDEAVFPAESD